MAVSGAPLVQFDTQRPPRPGLTRPSTSLNAADLPAADVDGRIKSGHGVSAVETGCDCSIRFAEPDSRGSSPTTTVNLLLVSVHEQRRGVPLRGHARATNEFERIALR